MAYSYTKVTAAAGQTSVPFNFDYLSTDEIKVSINDVETTAWSLSSPNIVALDSALAGGEIVEVERVTNLTTRAVDFSSGAVLTEEDLDLSAQQVFNAVQEAIDSTEKNLAETYNGQYDAENKRIVNLADPVDAQDAVTKAHLDYEYPAVLNVSNNVGDVNTVATNMPDINEVQDNITDINTVVTNMSDINTVATNIDDVITVANDLNEAISEIETAANDLNETVSEIEVVANNIDNVNIAANNFVSINTTADNITSVQSVHANVADIVTVADNVTDVTKVAAIDSDVTKVANIDTDVTTVAGSITNVNALAYVDDAMQTIADNISDVGTVAVNIADITSVADNISDVTNFADVYLGGKASDPATRNDGSALQTGDLYFNTAVNELRTYSGSQWVSGTAGTMAVQRFTGDGATASFTLSTAPSGENNTQVYVNGIYQQKDTYSVSGTSLILSEAPEADQVVEVVTISTLALGETDASLVAYTGTKAGSVETTIQNKLSQVVNVKDFGAKGDYNASTGTGTDDTAAIQAAIDACENGVLYFPEGHYKVTDTITIAGKNDQNDWTQGQFLISAYGAKIWSTADGSTPIVRIVRCKQLHIQGLRLNSISGYSPTYSTSVLGMWKSKWEDCFMGATEFGGFPDGAWDSHYWNSFNNCNMGPLYFYTNTTADRHEFNQNIFYSCNIGARDYSIYKYGSQGIQDLRFIGCDLSYYAVGILYVDEQTTGNIQFDSGYFDSSGEGIPKDTKGIQVDVTGTIATPNSANVETYWLSGNGSRATSRANLGVRDGQRDPTSVFNIIKNGSMRASGNAGFYTNSLSVSDVDTAEGYYNRYKVFTPYANWAEVRFESVPAPYTGSYTFTLISKTTGDGWGNKVTINGGSDNYGAVGSSVGEWTVSSYTTYLNEGDIFQCHYYHPTASTAPTNLEVAYAGMTFGAVGNLGSIELPDADYYSPVSVENGFDQLHVNEFYNDGGIQYLGSVIREEYVEMSYTPSTASQDILFVSTSGHELFEVTIHIRDGSYPNGTIFQKLYVACRGSGSTVTAVNYLQEDKARVASGAGFTAYPTWTVAVSGTNVMLSCTSNSNSSGSASIRMLVRGSHLSVTPQL